MRLSLPFLAFFLCSTATLAQANPQPDGALHVTSSPLTHQTKRVWYGWQLLLVDAASLGMIGAFHYTENSAGIFAAGGLPVFGAPIVHGLHGRSERAAGSFALRALLAFGGMGLVGTTVGPDCTTDYCMHPAPLILSGVLSGMIDGFLLQNEAVETPSKNIAIVPTMEVGSGHLTMGLSGSF